MSWLVIICIYSYTIGLILCFYEGMRVERDIKQAKISARVIRPVNITIVENVEVKALKPAEINFPNTESVG